MTRSRAKVAGWENKPWRTGRNWGGGASEIVTGTILSRVLLVWLNANPQLDNTTKMATTGYC